MLNAERVSLAQPQARMNPDLRRSLAVVGVGVCLCVVLIGTSIRWPELLQLRGFAAYLPATSSAPPIYPLLELLKLVVSGLLGIVVTGVLRSFRHLSVPSRSLEQCQVLLCISGAFVMIIIGDSLARAFGIVGAAGVVRFRTPVENPRDTAVLFLLIGIGMACGVNAFGLAGLVTILVCVTLGVLNYLARWQPQTLMMEVTTEGSELPTAEVLRVLDDRSVAYESCGISRGKKNNTTTTYILHIPQSVTPEMLHQSLQKISTPRILSVSWYSPRRRSD
jgi:hypothetical protein